MDLFFDNYYIKDCENKINYYRLMYDRESAGSEYTVLNNSGGVVHKTDTTFLIVNSDIDNVKVINSLGVYCQEFKISNTAKKFIL
jgi:uncharacterized protein YaaQ